MIVRRYGEEINAIEFHVGLAVLRQCRYIPSPRHRVICQLTCHFRQPGLKDGAPSWTPSLLEKIQSVFLSRFRGDRCGSSLIGYVCRGNFSKRRRIGCGVLNHRGEVSLAWFWGRYVFGRCSNVASASCGIAHVHTDGAFWNIGNAIY